MAADSRVLVCLTTVENADQADQLAATLIDRRLAACVQIDGPIRSHYQWKGDLCCETEFRLVIKTAADKRREICDELKSLHPYEQPQIVTLEAVDAETGYANWVWDQTRSD